jgi:hypothetical protein
VANSKAERVEHPTARELTGALGGDWNDIRRKGKARCPAHDDGDPSLDIEIGDDGKVIFVCRAGCRQDSVLAALRRRGLWPDAPPTKPRKKTGGKFNVVATYSYQREDGAEHFQVARLNPKSFRQRRPDGKGGYEWKGPDTHVPYRLPEVIEAVANGHVVFVVEGEKDCDSLAKLGITATCNAGGAGKWTAEHAAYLKGADVIIVPDNDAAGRDHVRVVRGTLSGVAQRVRVLELPNLPEKGDASDWLAAGGTVEELWQLAEDSAQDVTNVIHIGDASAKSPKQERSRDDASQPAHWPVEPWHEHVDDAALLISMADLFERYMVLPKHSAQALALWVMHAWAIDAFDISPVLAVISPTKRCGKSTLLTILLYLTPRSSPASNISAAAVYRYVESEKPTLILDEADSFMAENEAMRNVMNAGHMRPLAYVIRMEGEGSKMKPRSYSVFGPKIVAAIKALADTVMDRSVKITLRRKQKGETRARLRLRDSEEFIAIRRKAMSWAADNMDALGAMDPEMPDKLNDRAADNWRPLMSIAAVVGGDWPKVAREAALALTGTIEDDDKGTKLLADIKRVFEKTGLEFFSSETLVAHLINLEDGPWAEWRRDGKPISARGVSNILKGFEIRPGKTRFANGYSVEDFREAWESYL